MSSQGFGNLFNPVSPKKNTSLISLAHAEPFACNYGTNKHIFTIDQNGEFAYGVPPRAIVTYLSGTARMAMINLTIVASVPDDELPKVVYITGSRSKLDEMENYALIKDLRDRGTQVVLVDRKDPHIISKLKDGKSDVVWTNYASQETYQQAVSILADGGNLNSYAGAVDPDLLIEMPIGPADTYSGLEEEVSENIAEMHHNESPNDPVRYRGLSREARVAFLGFEDADDRLQAYLQKNAFSHKSFRLREIHCCLKGLESASEKDLFTDVFIAGSGEKAENSYANIESRLARSAAVNFIDGDLTVPIRSRHAHYVSRHQICGENVPWHMTNTSEPHSDDMVEQANNPVSFDWMVKGICGLSSVPHMMEKVEAEQPFGSFYSFY